MSERKCCKNCAYGMVRENVPETMPNIICIRKIKCTEKLSIVMLQGDCRCKNWKSKGLIRNER